MSNVIKFKKSSLKKKHKGKTLCRSGFHKWEVDNNNQLDNKFGKLVTKYQCRRCGKTKVTSQ